MSDPSAIPWTVAHQVSGRGGPNIRKKGAKQKELYTFSEGSLKPSAKCQQAHVQEEITWDGKNHIKEEAE